MIDAVTRNGLAGIQSGFQLAAKSADRISKAFLPDSKDDAVGAIVDLGRAEQQVKASSAVVRVGDEMLGTLVDLFA